MSILSNTPRIAVVRGGPSEEFEVSMQTGASVLAALRKNQYQPLDVVITRSGEWLYDGIVRNPTQFLPTIDMVFIALHGSYGEDGQLQRLLEKFGVPYTGSNPYASSVAMNKMITKEHLRESGIKMAPHIRVSRADSGTYHRLVDTIDQMFGPEYVIKPISGGSSIGTKMAAGKAELVQALSEVLGLYEEVLVEKRVRGREATCGIIENFRGSPVYLLPEVEIVPPQKADFFAADVKYTGETEEICPGRFKDDEKRGISDAANLVHTVLGLRQYSRADFIVAEDGVYFLEVNTLPGLTPQSLLPKALTAIGASYEEFIDHLVQDTLARASKSLT